MDHQAQAPLPTSLDLTASAAGPAASAFGDDSDRCDAILHSSPPLLALSFLSPKVLQFFQAVQGQELENHSSSALLGAHRVIARGFRLRRISFLLK